MENDRKVRAMAGQLVAQHGPAALELATGHARRQLAAGDYLSLLIWAKISVGSAKPWPRSCGACAKAATERSGRSGREALQQRFGGRRGALLGAADEIDEAVACGRARGLRVAARQGAGLAAR